MDLSLIDWSRAQFALTAMFHWVFVPLTLGLGVIMCIYETIYYRTGDEKWKRLAKFWIKLFGINFAIGVATGIILEFEFGTNWSNYSYFVGDIFGAPLAIEGIVAFFLEATFIGVLFFGWDKVSKGFHLASTWLTVGGATLSAWWILVANAWMQFPAGMDFNPDTARNELTDFWAVALSPVAVNKFFHTVLSAWMLGAAFVIGVSSYYLLKKRDTEFAKNSIKIATLVGIAGIVLTFWTGHGSAQKVAKHQPMKLAAMEGLYEGKAGAGLVGIGILNPSKEAYNDSENPFLFKIEFPKMLSWLAYSETDSYVAGIKDLVDGNEAQGIISVEEKMEMGKMAQQALKTYRTTECDSTKQAALIQLDENIGNFGYGFFKEPKNAVPPVGITFYAFHIMVLLGGYFLIFFIAYWFFNKKGILEKNKWLQILALISIPLAYICSQAGWVVAEVGRQPWAIQDILPLSASVSKIPTSSVQITFFVFLAVFSILLIAELGIMVKAIKKGVDNE
ncbi:MAG: cytochrome ubiquinol oxidase subunit I [Prevotellaceae bacterium]|jgi:cytochrome d ubiquinol oxidase subunit I|nr:cytochrome ubiquinol oxidase subunit I [Prevotellaceae bacterium]